MRKRAGEQRTALLCRRDNSTRLDNFVVNYFFGHINYRAIIQELSNLTVLVQGSKLHFTRL